jgi:hypothetical protein
MKEGVYKFIIAILTLTALGFLSIAIAIPFIVDNKIRD